MSLLKAIKAQLGLSNTPANNFTITAEADNGTLKLARGNAGATTQDILTVDAAGKVKLPQNAQTWQDVTASRAAGTTYTNSTGQPIMLNVSFGSGTAQYLTLTINALVNAFAGYVSSTSSSNIQVLIPDGATYSIGVGTSLNLNKWMELR